MPYALTYAYLQTGQCILALTNNVIKRFYASFKEKIKHDRKRARLTNSRAHDSDVLYAWARETAYKGQQHYHGIIFLNHDAYNSLGIFELGRKNNYNRLIESWASALQIPVEKAVGLVHIPKNAAYRIDACDRESQKTFFKGLVIFAKRQPSSMGTGNTALTAANVKRQRLT
ncbi:YagK/YfjJ domain-containing protein [Stutzerimonas nitrititolerans]|uniref:YagK/YfjJ domain-containing protein n=1 Tax=Stutzerimonas nitrititolerans TaxID=2482751 RepID=UPI00289B7979|nr:inovirus-type Gp2 protein [Stutzerimonas nitrititolerans]